MDERTGQWITGIDVTRQRIARTLRIQRGSLPVLRGFGSDIRRLIDQPGPYAKAHITHEVFCALHASVAEFTCANVNVTEQTTGKISLEIHGSTKEGSLTYATDS